jgi:hypothetical protein
MSNTKNNILNKAKDNGISPEFLEVIANSNLDTEQSEYMIGIIENYPDITFEKFQEAVDFLDAGSEVIKEANESNKLFAALKEPEDNTNKLLKDDAPDIEGIQRYGEVEFIDNGVSIEMVPTEDKDECNDNHKDDNYDDYDNDIPENCL